jgi:hypothetical protein
MSNLSLYSGYYSFSPYDSLNLNPSLTSIYSNSEASPSVCSLDQAEHLAIEIFRIGWVISFSIESSLRNAIGAGFLASVWLSDPAWGSKQEAFNQIGQKVADFAVCSARGVFQNIRGGWSYLKASLKSEKPAVELREKVIPKPIELGEFSDTPLVVSDDQLSLPNVVTLQEFENLQKVYEAIKSGHAGIRIEGSDSFVKLVLKDLRIILSTQVGRDLINSLYEKKLLITERLIDLYIPDKRQINLRHETSFEFTFGAPDSDKINILSSRPSILFHELTHAYHDLITGDLTKHLLKKSYEESLWTNEEEKRTILKENEFRRQLKEGEENWYGRCYHHILGKTTRTSVGSFDFFPLTYWTFPQKIKLLLAYKLRLDEKTTTSDSINQYYDTHIIKDPNFYLPSMARGGHFELIRSLLKSTSSKDLSALALSKALKNASLEGYEEIAQLITDFLLTHFYSLIKIPADLVGQTLATFISIGHHQIVNLILNFCDLETVASRFTNEHFNSILNYVISSKDEARALHLLNSNKFIALKVRDIKRLLIHAIEHELKLIIGLIINSQRFDEFSLKDLAYIFDGLSHLGDEKYLQILLGKIDFTLIKGSDLAKSLEQPYYRKKDNVVQLFIKNACLNLAQASKVPETGLGSLLRLAASYGDAESLRFILNSKSIELNVDDLGESFLGIAHKKNNKALQAFQESSSFNQIPIDYISRALNVAYHSNNEALIDFLLSSNRFQDVGPFYIEDLALRSSFHGNLKFTQFMVNSEQFAKTSTDFLNNIFTNACCWGWEGIVQQLLESDRIDEIEELYFEKALLQARETGNVRIEKILLDHSVKK